jgi:hypothetical protein
MRSRITSVASEARTLGLPASAVLGMAQVLCVGDQKARYYDWMSPGPSRDGRDLVLTLTTPGHGAERGFV